MTYCLGIITKDGKVTLRGPVKTQDEQKAIGQIAQGAAGVSSVLIGGTMGTGSYILCGTAEGMRLSFGSACHGAGRSMSRTQATKKWKGRERP